MDDIKDLAVIERAGQYIAKSGLFGVKSPDQAIALMLVAQAEGRNAFEAARDYHIIDGRPSLKAEAMLARFQQAGGRVRWITSSDKECSAEFSHPAGGTLTINWTIERAKTAGLTGKKNWMTYPAQMLRARTISEGVRAVYPGACSGMYTPEEIQDIAPQEGATVEFVEDKPADKPPEEAQPKPQVAPQKPSDWDLMELKNKAKELIRTKAIDQQGQKDLWSKAKEDWAEFVKLLEAEEMPIF